MTTRNHAATAASTAVDSTDDPIVTFRSHVIPKLGAHAKGSITYAVGIGPDGAVCLSIVANQGGGYYSKEWVAFGRICEVLAHFRTSGNAFITQTLLAAFGNRSTNNAGFLAAILRHERLLHPAADKPHCHVLNGDWAHWEKEQQGLAANAIAQASGRNGNVAVADYESGTGEIKAADGGQCVDNVDSQNDAVEHPQPVMGLNGQVLTGTGDCSVTGEEHATEDDESNEVATVSLDAANPNEAGQRGRKDRPDRPDRPDKRQPGEVR